ncbi:MAG: CcoQ/FixQ family Cbb3-type cytochrome c oxidase assembly chaperone [Alphaproteobacteria bacterium CG11_big_fil_rev_8_21_14_0_20_44_7]|nr:MAG: CcoQ/FixQ family Cbb3-type cytochrome c oxidase assembly chaperone [Alphaproteobacteria bacterium CG11_big_fil_rev_8_21_14_0_20_44_7]
MDSGTAGIIGLLFFFIVFLGIAIWTLNPKNKKRIEELKNIPLKDESNE